MQTNCALDTATKDAVHKVIEKLAKAEDWNMRQLVELTQLRKSFFGHGVRTLIT